MSDIAKPEYCMQYCKYQFTPEELREIAKTLAHKTQELGEIEEEKKAVASAFKERSDRVQAEQRSAARKYKDGYEMRNIECLVQRDYDAGVIRYIRTDNGEIASETKMTMAERQMTLSQALHETNEEGAKQQVDDSNDVIDVEYEETQPQIAGYLDDKSADEPAAPDDAA